MKITKENDYYLLKNKDGEYHLSIKDYEKLGKDKAIELATSEIEKKVKNKQYTNQTINFSQARSLGFCEYGIKDFANNLGLDINKQYSIAELKEALTLDMLKKYPSECLKLFGKSIIDKFGGVISILENNKSDSSIFYFIIDNFVADDILHKFSIKAAYYSLKNFESTFPNDDRPRKAIEAKEKFLRGEIDNEQLSAAQSAAYSAAESAYSAAYSAYSAARLAEWSAAESAYSAARSAAYSAADSAAESAYSAYSAADSAAYSAYSVADSAAESAAEPAYIYFSEELIKLLKE